VLRRFEGHAARVNAVAWGGSEDGVLVSGSFDATMKIWDAKSQSIKALMTLSEAKDSVADVAVRGAEIVTASVDGRVRTYDVRMGRCLVDVIGSMCHVAMLCGR
jgi:mitogen-activated protein kinase organizer 1